MKNKGFIKLYRSMLSKPEMTDLVNEQGAVGFGVYLMIVLHLSQCDDYEGMFTNGQLRAFAAQAKTTRRNVRHIIEDFGLFEINGNRFKTATKSEESSNKTETKSSHSHARNNRYAGEDVEIDIEKEKKEKGTKVPDMIGPSAYEVMTREGLRQGGHGEPVPWWAPPQRDVYMVWSLVADRWVPPAQIDAEFRNRADYGLVLVNDDKQCARNGYHLLKIIVDKVRDDAMGHKGTCHVSFDPQNYRHGMVQTIHQTEQFKTYNILDISGHCWLSTDGEQTEIPWHNGEPF